jgi:hypothetical protein
MNEDIARKYIETDFLPECCSKVLLKIRLDGVGIEGTCISCLKLESLSLNPSEQEVVFLDP